MNIWIWLACGFVGWLVLWSRPPKSPVGADLAMLPFCLALGPLLIATMLVIRVIR